MEENGCVLIGPLAACVRDLELDQHMLTNGWILSVNVD